MVDQHNPIIPRARSGRIVRSLHLPGAHTYAGGWIERAPNLGWRMRD
jgi:hypothetical protein